MSRQQLSTLSSLEAKIKADLKAGDDEALGKVLAQAHGEISKAFSQFVMHARDAALGVSSQTSELPDVPANVQALIPVGLPRNRADIQRSFQSATISAKLTKRSSTVFGREATGFFSSVQNAVSGGEIILALGTRISVTLSNRYSTGVTIEFEPALVVSKDLSPVDVRIRSLTFDFRSASFKANAEGAGLDSVYTWLTETIANGYFKELVPPVLRTGSYSPRTDPDLEGTIQKIKTHILEKIGSKPSASTAPTVGINDLSDAYASLDLTVTHSEVVIPILDKANIKLGAGQDIGLSVSATGTLLDPRITTISLNTYGAPVSIKLSGDGIASTLSEVRVRSLNISAGGKVSADYDLVAAGLLQGLTAMVGLLAARNGDPRGLVLANQAGNIRLQGIKNMIDAKITEHADPMLRSMLTTYNNFIPGFQLTRIFSVQ